MNFSRNKKIFSIFTQNDTFSDRLIILLFHLGFFIKNYKNSVDKKEMQNIYDYIFRQLELSIREIGYGDASINKKMKNYVNFFYDLLSKLDKWDEVQNHDKSVIIENYFINLKDITFFINYFDNYWHFLLKSSFNSFLKGVINAKF